MNSVELKIFNEFMFDIKFGYTSFKDFTSSFFGTWYPVISAITGISIGIVWFGTAAIIGHIEAYWYSPFSSLAIVILAICLDWFFGVYNAYKKHQLNTRMAQRVVIMVIANFFILSLLYNTVKYQISGFENETATALGYVTCKLVALYLTGVHTVSALKNAVMAEIVNATWATWLTSKIDKHKTKIDELI